MAQKEAADARKEQHDACKQLDIFRHSRPRSPSQNKVFSLSAAALAFANIGKLGAVPPLLLCV